MTTRYRVIMYERSTERVGGMIDVPQSLVGQALTMAGISNAMEPGESQLSDVQVGLLAQLLGFRANVSRYIYHLETLVVDPLHA